MEIRIVEHHALSEADRRAIIDLCARAYEHEFDSYFPALKGARHFLAFEDGRLVSHVCYVERWLQQEGHEALRTAYIEAVATDPSAEKRGYGTALMRAAGADMQRFPMAALCTGSQSFYARLGWLDWTGPTFVRTPTGLEEAPDEPIMYLPTAATPAWLDPSQPISCEWRDAPEQW